MNKLSKLQISELKNRLSSLKEDLDDIQMEKSMILGQTGLHISSKKILEQKQAFDNEILKIKKLIIQVEEELKSRK